MASSYFDPVESTIYDFPSALKSEEKDAYKKRFNADGDPGRPQKTSWYDKTKSDLFAKSMYDRLNREESAKKESMKFGDSIGAKGGEIMPGFGYLSNAQHAPMYIPGEKGSSSSGGLFGDIGGAAGMLGTAFGVFGPLGAPIGAMAGKLIDRAVG